MDIKELAISRAIAMLNAADAKYKIVMPDGREFGELEVKPPRIRKRSYRYPPGEMSAYWRPLVKDFEVGTVLSIPFGKFDGVHLRGTMSGYFTTTYGKGAVMTSINHETKTIECLRVS